MKCIFFQEKSQKSYCTIDVPQIARGDLSEWDVDDETLQKYCVTDAFNDCPRLRAYMEYLQKTHK